MKKVTALFFSFFTLTALVFLVLVTKQLATRGRGMQRVDCYHSDRKHALDKTMNRAFERARVCVCVWVRARVCTP